MPYEILELKRNRTLSSRSHHKIEIGLFIMTELNDSNELKQLSLTFYIAIILSILSAIFCIIYIYQKYFS